MIDQPILSMTMVAGFVAGALLVTLVLLRGVALRRQGARLGIAMRVVLVCGVLAAALVVADLAREVLVRRAAAQTIASRTGAFEPSPIESSADAGEGLDSDTRREAARDRVERNLAWLVDRLQAGQLPSDAQRAELTSILQSTERGNGSLLALWALYELSGISEATVTGATSSAAGSVDAVSAQSSDPLVSALARWMPVRAKVTAQDGASILVALDGRPPSWHPSRLFGIVSDSVELRDASGRSTSCESESVSAARNNRLAVQFDRIVRPEPSAGAPVTAIVRCRLGTVAGKEIEIDLDRPIHLLDPIVVDLEIPIEPYLVGSPLR